MHEKTRSQSVIRSEADTPSAGTPRILYCHCAFSRVVPEEVKSEVLRGLARSGAAFDAVPDLCELAARKDPALERLAAADGPVEIVACYPRAVRWLFHASDVPLPEDGVTIHNQRESDAPSILADLGLGADEPAPGERIPDGADEPAAAVELTELEEGAA
ncbi:MAG: hypothetical protein MI919_14635 [Holophagales bacterium]|nr:hypothetical protein [Holophagales bacterium]